MKTIISTIVVLFSIFFVSSVNAQTDGSKALDEILKMKGTSNEDVTDKYKGTYRYNERTGEYTLVDYQKSTVRNHYWYASATAGFDSKSSGVESNLKFGRHMRGFNAYVSGGVRQISLDKELDAKALAVQAALGLQWEVVSTFAGHSRLQVAVGPEFGFHNLDYKPAEGYRWYGFAPSFGGALNVDYKVSESFSIGAYAKYTQFKVNNEWKDFETKQVYQSKVDYKTFSVGVSITWNINVKL